jgi:hypothetical protein
MREHAPELESQGETLKMEIIKKVETFVQSLLEYDAAKIITSRKNFDRLNTKDDLIVIDNLFNTPIGRFNTYDGTLEEPTQTLTTRFSGQFSISFYGDNALQNALEFQNLLLSEQAFEIQSEHGIKVFLTSTHNNLRIQDGTTWNNLYQCDFKVQYDESFELITEPIETAQLTFINN